VFQVELAEGYEVRCNLSRRLTMYEEAKSFHRVLGGPLQEFNDCPEELKSKKTMGGIGSHRKDLYDIGSVAA
jgi:hypothetical protein